MSNPLLDCAPLKNQELFSFFYLQGLESMLKDIHICLFKNSIWYHIKMGPGSDTKDLTVLNALPHFRPI